MSFYTLTTVSPAGGAFTHTGGTLEVIIAKESVLRSSAEITIQYETASGSGVYKTLPETDLKSPTVALYQLSACNVKAVLVSGDASTTAEVRLVSVA